MDLCTQVNCLIFSYPKQTVINLNLTSGKTTDDKKVSIHLMYERMTTAFSVYNNEVAAFRQLETNGTGQVYGIPKFFQKGRDQNCLVIVMQDMDFSLSWLKKNGVLLSEDFLMHLLMQLVWIIRIYYNII